ESRGLCPRRDGLGHRGRPRGGATRLAGPDWVEANVKRRGALGALYPNYRGGDIWSRTLGPVRGVKEGDTPSFLNLVANGLTDPAEPTWGGWGGRFVRVQPGRQLVSDARAAGTPDEPEGYMARVHRGRPDFPADYAALVGGWGWGGGWRRRRRPTARRMCECAAPCGGWWCRGSA